MLCWMTPGRPSREHRRSNSASCESGMRRSTWATVGTHSLDRMEGCVRSSLRRYTWLVMVRFIEIFNQGVNTA